MTDFFMSVKKNPGCCLLHPKGRLIIFHWGVLFYPFEMLPVQKPNMKELPANNNKATGRSMARSIGHVCLMLSEKSETGFKKTEKTRELG